MLHDDAGCRSPTCMPVASAVLSMQEFIEKLEAAAQQCGIRLRRMDKKSEKAACSAHKARLMQILHSEQSPSAVLALALPLLVLKTSNKLVSIPGRAMGGVLALLQAKMAPEQHSLLQQFHELVVDSLKAASACKAAGLSSESQQQLDKLLPDVKSLVGVETATDA